MIGRVARQLGIGAETLGNWENQAEVDGGQRSGTSSEERRRIAELEKENRELRRANEMLAENRAGPKAIADAAPGDEDVESSYRATCTPTG